MKNEDTYSPPMSLEHKIREMERGWRMNPENKGFPLMIDVDGFVCNLVQVHKDMLEVYSAGKIHLLTFSGMRNVCFIGKTHDSNGGRKT